MARRTKESSLADKVINYLDELIKRGLPIMYEHRSGSGGFNYKKGVPDFYVVINGQHLEIELKAPEGRLSTMQEKFKYRCEQIRHIPYLCPRTLEEVKEFIDNYI